MRFHPLILSFFAALVVAAPVPNDEDIQLQDGSWLKISNVASSAEKSKRSQDDKISSCGPRSGWIPVKDHDLYLDQTMWGYNSTVHEFCSRTTYDFNGNPVILAAGRAASYIVRWQYDAEGMKNDTRGPRVGLKDGWPGHIEFEVHNKRSNGKEYTMNEDDCNTYMMKMADPSSSCYGQNNKDTKGGTWQMEDNTLTFHAFPVSDNEPIKLHDELKI